jgi:hypothetical protein
MIGARRESPALYSLVLVVPDQTLWCSRPKPCPDSCAAASAMLAIWPEKRWEKTQTVLDSALLKPPT